MPADYPIGYRRPPVSTRFVKGQSGNLAGRPPSTKSLTSLLQNTLNELVLINENGRQKKITKLAAMVKQATNKAAGGDRLWFKTVMDLLRGGEARGAAADLDNDTITGADRRQLKQLLDQVLGVLPLDRRRELLKALNNTSKDGEDKSEPPRPD